MATFPSSGNSYTFKVTIGNETRRFSLPKKCTSWHTLCAVLWSSFQNLDNQSDLVLYYRDNDHDVITLSSDMELTELLRQPEAVSSNSVVRLYGERRQDDATMAWVFAPEEDTMLGHTNHGDNTSTPYLEKVNQVDGEQQQQQQPAVEAEQQRDPFSATFEQLGQLMDRFRDTIQDNPEVMRVMSQMASTITTSISNNTHINLAPLEEWLQSLSQSQHPSENLYPMPSDERQQEEDIWITRASSQQQQQQQLDGDHDPPRYEEPTEPYPFYDTKPAVADSSTRAGDDTMYSHHPPPPPPPPPAPAPMFMESSLYPPPPPFIGPLWSRVLRTVGSSLGWNNGPQHYNAARYYSPPVTHHHHHPPPPPPMPMHPPPLPTQMPLPPPPPPRRWDSVRRHHHQRRQDHHYPSTSPHHFEHDNRWNHHHPHSSHSLQSSGKYHHHHHHHPTSMQPPSFAPFGTAAASSSTAGYHHHPWYNAQHECRHTRSELKKMRKQERKERHQLRRERRAEKKRLRKEKRKIRRQARKERHRNVMDGYDSSTSTSSSSSGSSSSSSSSILSLSDDDHAHEELAYRVERLRVNNNDSFNKPTVDVNKEKKQQ